MAQIDKNTVAAENQLGKNKSVTFECENAGGVRILFVGNSITRHAPKAEIGWNCDWGMAASAKDKDYVHMTKKAVLDKAPKAEFCICQAADWEKAYRNGAAQLEKFKEARDFDADIIVMRLIENCERESFDAEIFKREYLHMLDFFNKSKKAKFIITTSFWKRIGDEVLEEIARENAMDFIYLGDLGEEAEMRADGLFEHDGVAAHPGDKGMEVISSRIFETMKKYL